MKFINDNLRKAGYFNTMLILIAIIMRLSNVNSYSIFIQIDSFICVIALVYGLIYALNGYDKEVSRYYRAFLTFYLISKIYAATEIFFIDIDIFDYLLNIIILICLFVLAIKKDLGKNRSFNLSLAILLLSFVKLVYGVLVIKSSTSLFVGSSDLVLSCVLCVFVSAKYKDKGTHCSN